MEARGPSVDSGIVLGHRQRVAAIGVAIAIGLGGCGSSSDVTPGQDPETLARNAAQARRFDGPEQLWVGETFGQLHLDVVTAPSPGRLFAFAYGECRNLDVEEDACNYPLQIENFSICDRLPARNAQLIDIRGAKANWRSGIDALEVYSGRTTAVIYSTRKGAFDAATALRHVNAPEPGMLAPPVPEALAGRSECR